MAAKAKCTKWPHAYDEGKARDGEGGCPVDRAQYLRESRRIQTSAGQRDLMRAAAHQEQNVDQAEDEADESDGGRRQ